MAWLRGFVASDPDDANDVAARLSTTGSSAEIDRSDDAVVFAFAGRSAPNLASYSASLVGLERGVAGLRIVNEAPHSVAAVTTGIGVTMSLVVAAADSDQARWSPFLVSLWRGLPLEAEAIEDGDFVVYRWDLDFDGRNPGSVQSTGKRLLKIAGQMEKEEIPHFACVFSDGFFSTQGDIDESSLGDEYPGPTATVSLRWTATDGGAQEIGLNDSGDIWGNAGVDVDLGFLEA